MLVQSRYLFSVDMDVDPDKDELFNEVYDEEHIPRLLEVPGVLSAARFMTRELKVVIGGEVRTIVVEGEPKYGAQYEIESLDTLTSSAWGEATEYGRWPEQVRPYTNNRRAILRELIYQAP